MREYIKRLQSKSEDTRKLIFLGSIIVCMSFVSFVWIYGLGVRFGNPDIAIQANNDIKPFKLFSNSIASTYNSMSASVGKVSKIKETLNTNTEKQINLTPIEYTN